MNELIKKLNEMLPEGITYGKLNNTDKSFVKGILSVYDMTHTFEFPKADGFPSPTIKAQTRVVDSAMEAFRVSVFEQAFNYIMSLQEENNDKKAKEQAI